MKIDFSWVAVATGTTSDYGDANPFSLDSVGVKIALPEIANRTLEERSPQGDLLQARRAERGKRPGNLNATVCF